MKLTKLLKNIDTYLLISNIHKICKYSNYKTENIIEMNFSFWYKKEKLILSDEFISDYPYVYIIIEYLYCIITSTQYYRQKLFIDKIGYIVFTKNNYPIITIKDKSLIYNKSITIDIGLLEEQLLLHYKDNKYWNILLFNTFLHITVSSFILYKTIKN